MTKKEQAAKLKQAMELALEVEKEHPPNTPLANAIFYARSYYTMAYNELNKDEDRGD